MGGGGVDEVGFVHGSKCWRGGVERSEGEAQRVQCTPYTSMSSSYGGWGVLWMGVLMWWGLCMGVSVGGGGVERSEGETQRVHFDV